MSTKSTILLTGHEHWYEEQNARYYEDANTDECIVLHIGPEHKVEQTEEGTFVVIESDTPLYKALAKAEGKV